MFVHSRGYQLQRLNSNHLYDHPSVCCRVHSNPLFDQPGAAAPAASPAKPAEPALVPNEDSQQEQHIHRPHLSVSGLSSPLSRPTSPCSSHVHSPQLTTESIAVTTLAAQSADGSIATSTYSPQPKSVCTLRDYGDDHGQLGELRGGADGGLTFQHPLDDDLASDGSEERSRTGTASHYNPAYSSSFEDLRNHAVSFANVNMSIGSSSLHAPAAAPATAPFDALSGARNIVSERKRTASAAIAMADPGHGNVNTVACCSRANCAICLALTKKCHGCAPDMSVLTRVATKRCAAV